MKRRLLITVIMVWLSGSIQAETITDGLISTFNTECLNKSTTDKLIKPILTGEHIIPVSTKKLKSMYGADSIFYGIPWGYTIHNQILLDGSDYSCGVLTTSVIDTTQIISSLKRLVGQIDNIIEPDNSNPSTVYKFLKNDSDVVILEVHPKLIKIRLIKHFKTFAIFGDFDEFCIKNDQHLHIVLPKLLSTPGFKLFPLFSKKLNQIDYNRDLYGDMWAVSYWTSITGNTVINGNDGSCAISMSTKNINRSLLTNLIKTEFKSIGTIRRAGLSATGYIISKDTFIWGPLIHRNTLTLSVIQSKK